MNTVYFDSPVSDDERRRLLYQGQLFVYSPTPSSRALSEFAQQLSEEAFAPYEPIKAQFEMPPEKYAAILEGLKPKFIHHPTSKKLIQGLLAELGCDVAKTYFDVPRLRTATSDNYLTSGLAYAFHPHRDTWYSAPSCQINWWIPVYDIVAENCMAFHPKYWSEPIKNSSRDYNYYRWNKESRGAAAKQIKGDTRQQPRAQEPMELEPQVRVVTKVGGILLFAAAHMHSTVPNTSGFTRFSIDFRTVHFDDVTGHVGAPNIDSECTGTTLRDYLRGSDLTRLPEDVVKPYDTEPPTDDAVLIYEAKGGSQ
ncbi:MAG: phytanoyl-CoA dioxygenase family protein [Verrucomicrobia bacterium]|nr:phytanoyl-CoA dioxygenase family protein [Verrucomicrobiota bacterium]